MDGVRGGEEEAFFSFYLNVELSDMERNHNSTLWHDLS